MGIFSFQLFCADVPITDPTVLFDHLDRAVKAKNKARIETLFLQPAQINLTSNHRNSLLERSLFFFSASEEKDMAFFLLEKQKTLKATRLGIHDILRLSISNSKKRPDVTNFVLFQITDETLRPERSVVVSCSDAVIQRKNAEFIKLFNDYLNPKPQSAVLESTSTIPSVVQENERNILNQDLQSLSLQRDDARKEEGAVIQLQEIGDRSKNVDYLSWILSLVIKY